MSRRLPSFGLPVLWLLLLPSIACDRTAVEYNATGPAPLNANVAIRSSFGVEPTTLRAESLPGTCGAFAPFGVRLGVTIRGGDDLIVRGLRFSFIDRTGARALPEIMPIPSLSAPVSPGGQMPSSSPVTVPGFASLPTTTSIPIPGSSPITGVVIPPGSHHRFDYFLRFSCIVMAEGEILIVIDTADRSGKHGSSELRVLVKS